MRDRAIQLVVWLAVRRPLVVIVLGAALAALGGWYAWTHLTLDANTDNLIASDRPFMERYTDFLEEFGDLEYMYVAVYDRAEPPDPEAARACVDELVERLRALPELPGVAGFITPDEQLRIATRAADVEELDGLALAGAGVGRLVEGVDATTALVTGRRLLGQATQLLGPDQAQRQRDGAAGILLLKSLAASMPDSASAEELGPIVPSRQQREYLVSDSGRMYFIEVLPVKDYGTLTVIEKPLRDIRKIIDEVDRRHPTVDVGLTGKPVLQADELATSQRDMTTATLGGFTIVTIIFMVVMRGVRRPAMAGIAFGMAFAWTYGFAALAVGRLNLLSMVFMLVLVGVGLDYGVHFISQYMELRRNRTTRDAVRLAIFAVLPGNVTGGLTSAVVFIAAVLTDFQGLRELGVIAGMGLVFCLIAMSLALPALLVVVSTLRHGRPVRVPRPPRDEAPAWQRLPLRHPFITLLLGVALAGGMATFATRVRFEGNLLELQAQGLDSVEWEHRILEDSISASWFGAVIVDRMDEIPPVLERATDQPTVGRTVSVLDAIRLQTDATRAARASFREAAATPAEPRALLEDETFERALEEAITRVDGTAQLAEAQAPAEAAGLRALGADLRDLLESVRRDPGAMARADATLRGIGDSFRTMLEGDAMEIRPALPDAIRARMVSPQGRFLVMVHPAGDIWEIEPMAEFIAALEAIDPEATGVPFTVYESAREMQQSFVFMALFSSVCITLIMLVDFRSIVDTLLVLLTLGFGIALTFEFMGLFGVSLNLANFFGIPILFGVTVDGSVHLLHRYHQGGPHRLWPAGTRRAVMLSAMTTTIGFGSLVFAHHRGLQSLGWIMIIGNLCCLTASLVVLPAMICLSERWRRIPAQQDYAA